MVALPSLLDGDHHSSSDNASLLTLLIGEEEVANSTVLHRADTTTTTDHHGRMIHWWIGLLELFVFLLGVPSNAAVFYFVHRTSRKRTLLLQQYVHNKRRRVTELFVISMSTADLLFCAVHAPMMFLSFNLEFNLSTVPCLTMFAVTHTSTVASSLSLLWLNFNKFLHLHRPLHHFLFITRTRAIGLIAASWAASIGWGLLLVLGPFIRHDAQCNIYLHHKSIYVVFAAVFFVMPTLVSLGISVYVALVVVDANSGSGTNSQKYIAHYHNRRFYSAERVDGAEAAGRKKSSTVASDDDHYRLRKPSRVHFESTAENNNDDSNKTKKKPLAPVLSTSRIFQRRRAFSPTSWPPPSHFRAISPAARRFAHIRRISFVFTTTIWTSLTALPYRLAYIVQSLPQPDEDSSSSVLEEEVVESSEEISTNTFDLAVIIYFCLFAIMTLNAAGNPLITILTQRQYSACLKETWKRMFRRKAKHIFEENEPTASHRHSLGRSSNDSCYSDYRYKKDALTIRDERRSGSIARTSLTSQLSSR